MGERQAREASHYKIDTARQVVRCAMFASDDNSILEHTHIVDLDDPVFKRLFDAGFSSRSSREELPSIPELEDVVLGYQEGTMIVDGYRRIASQLAWERFTQSAMTLGAAGAAAASTVAAAILAFQGNRVGAAWGVCSAIVHTGATPLAYRFFQRPVNIWATILAHEEKKIRKFVGLEDE